MNRKTEGGSAPRRVEVRFAVDPVRVFKLVLAITLGVALVSAAVNLLYRATGSNPDQYTRHFFDVDSEANPPTWWNVIELVAVGVLAMIVGDRPRSVHARRYRRMWIVGGWIAIAMSVDELSSIHEALNDRLHNVIGGGTWLHFAWVVPAFLIAVAVAVLYGRFTLALPRRIGAMLAYSAFAYVFSAAFLEMVDGKVNGLVASPLAGWKIALTTIQEFGEQSSLAVAIFALLLMIGFSDEQDRVGGALAEEPLADPVATRP